MTIAAAIALPRPKWRYVGLGLALGLGALAATVLTLGIHRGEVVSKMRSLPLATLVIAAGGALGIVCLQALRWWIVMRPVLDLSYARAIAALSVGYLFNTFLPARGGDLVRVQYLGKKTGVSRAKLLGTEIVDFWSDKWGWIATFPLVCLVGSPPRWLFHAFALLGAAVVGVGVVLALMASGRFRHGQPAWLANLRAGFAANHWKRLLLLETLIAPLPWLWETLVIFLAARSLGMPLTIMQAFAVLTAFNVAMIIPSPGNLGSLEAGGTLALVFFGVPKETALAFLCAYHLSQVIPTVLLGSSVLVVEGGTLFGKPSPGRG